MRRLLPAPGREDSEPTQCTSRPPSPPLHPQSAAANIAIPTTCNEINPLKNDFWTWSNMCHHENGQISFTKWWETAPSGYLELYSDDVPCVLTLRSPPSRMMSRLLMVGGHHGLGRISQGGEQGWFGSRGGWGQTWFDPQLTHLSSACEPAVMA